MACLDGAIKNAKLLKIIYWVEVNKWSGCKFWRKNCEENFYKLHVPRESHFQAPHVIDRVEVVKYVKRYQKPLVGSKENP